MSKSILEIVYSRQTHDYVKGRSYSNPRYFTTPRSGVTKVYVVGDWPNVVQAYKAAGVPVVVINEEEAILTGELIPVTATDEEKLANEPKANNYGHVEIPEDWRDMDWVGEHSMRKLATQLTDSHILNKSQAMAVIAAELARRGGAESSDDQ